MKTLMLISIILLSAGCDESVESNDIDLTGMISLTTSVGGEGCVEVTPRVESFVRYGFNTNIYYYNRDSAVEVILNAYPDDGWSFSHWVGAVNGIQNPIVIPIDTNRAIAAMFIRE